MNYRRFTAVVLLLLIVGIMQAYKPLTPAAQPSVMAVKQYRLVWADEFNTEGLPDSTNWNYEYGFVRNQEYQWYQPQNAFCKNGCLIIEARREHKPNPNYDANSKDWRLNRPFIDYTAACLLTKHKHSWQYGRFEMRARIDISAGLWPAWWTLGVEQRWPANGEIDMMEYYRGKLLANIGCLGANKKQNGIAAVTVPILWAVTNGPKLFMYGVWTGRKTALLCM